jgi:hypothetical protein
LEVPRVDGRADGGKSREEFVDPSMSVNRKVTVPDGSSVIAEERDTSESPAPGSGGPVHPFVA